MGHTTTTPISRKMVLFVDSRLFQIPNEDTQNYPFSRLQLVVEMFGINEPSHQNSIKVYKVKRIRKRYYKTLGSSAINNPMSPLSQISNCYKKF